MRLLRDLRLLITENDDGTGVKKFDDQDALGRTETLDTFFNVENSGEMPVVAAQPFEPLPVGKVLTIKALLVAPDQPIEIRFTGASGQTLTVGAPASGRGMLYWEPDTLVGGVEIRVPGATNASVLYAVAGLDT